MKQSLLCTLAVLALILGQASCSEKQPDEPTPVPPTPEKPDTIKILAIGNSWSRDAVEENLYELLKAEDVEGVIGNMYIGGCDLETHWKNADGNLPAYSYRKIVKGVRTVTANQTLLKALKDEKWDYISFQQGAGLYGKYETFKPYLPNLMDYCRKNCANPNFKTVYHETWAAAKNSTNKYFVQYFNSDQKYMYDETIRVVQLADADYHFDLIMPVGDAIQSGRTSKIGDEWNSDGWHLNVTRGRYAAACTWCEMLTGNDVTKNSYSHPKLTEQEKNICQAAAHNAAIKHYTVTDLSAMPYDGPGETGTVLAQWVLDKARAVSDGYKETYTSASTALGSWIYSNAPGVAGYINSNGVQGGRLSYIQVDKTAIPGPGGTVPDNAGRMLLNGNPGGQPAVCGVMENDCWQFETTGAKGYTEGKYQFYAVMYSVAAGPKYWRVEYFDKGEWKAALPLQSATVGGKEIKYNIALEAKKKYEVDVTVTTTDETDDIKFRIVCCSNYQIDGNQLTYPNKSGEMRIAGTEADKNLPKIVAL